MNWLSFRFNLVKAIERENKSINDLGSVYYAISLFLLILVDFLLFDEIKFAVLPILIMGYGDGLSAVIGKKFKSILILGNKTLYGTITMLMVSVILTIIMGYDLPTILIISISAAFVELVTPKGFDNLTVPILIYALLYFFVSL
ncbi:MAG: hypothetical protein JXB08_02730 [Bacilli bacterium]|nr:hypothetical protein [Bacilli bacterium]